MVPDDAHPLAPEKFQDPAVTATGEVRARVKLKKLQTLWFNTGTLCNLTCRNCYIESSPTNDRLAYLSRADAAAYLDEIAKEDLGTTEIGFTGGEPFMNREFPDMLEDALVRGFKAIVLTNAMKPMMKVKDHLLDIQKQHGESLTMRVSVDHYTREGHETERGPRSWEPTMAGLRWLADNGFNVHVAGRMFSNENEERVRAGYAALFSALGLTTNANSPEELVLFPEMDASLDVPEITTACWGILGVNPESVMCASSRMVIKRKGSDKASVAACTLLPYDLEFDLGSTLSGAMGEVALNHPHCARFCVLGGASCS